MPHNLFRSAKFDWRAEKNIITTLFLLAHALRVSQSTWLAQRVYYENQKRFSEWWRRWFGSARDGYYTALGILRSRYGDEKQHAARFVQHAQKMQYSQFRDALLRIAADESKHADWIKS